MRIVNLFVASSFLLAAGCSSMGNGVIAVEANAILLDNYEAKDPISGTDFDSNIDAKGYGLQAAFNTPIVDFTAGYERRQFDSADANEGSVGVRKRWLDIVGLQPYLDLRVLFGQFDSDGDNSDYTGLSLGGGAIFNIGDHLFFDANVSYEVTDSIDVGSDSTALQGLLVRGGIGWSF